MILGFVAIGFVLSFWTVKSTVGMPVHESNEYMMKYQVADKGANEILEAEKLFDDRYRIELIGMKLSDFKPKHLKRKDRKIVALEKSNTITYRISDLNGKGVDDANVSLLLTRPHTEKDDRSFRNIKGNDGLYTLKNVEIEKPGRYILRVRAQVGDAVKYMDTEAYLKP